MTNQFIAHADAPRTFADEKGATKAVKRDLGKHFDTHGDVLFDTGTEIKPAPEAKAKPAAKSSRKSGEINVDPTSPLIHCRAGSKQQQLVDALAKGCTMDDLRTICVRRDGTTWDDNSIRSAFYFDVKQKGYGVRTEWAGDVATYHIVLPEGYDAPLPAKERKS